MRIIWAILTILVMQPAMGSNDTLNLSDFKAYGGYCPIKHQKEWALEIAKTKGITTLNINNCGVTDEILEILKDMPLIVLYINDNWISDEGVKYLPASLDELYISSNRLTAKCLDHMNQQLAHLDISGNEIDPSNNELFGAIIKGG